MRDVTVPDVSQSLRLGGAVRRSTTARTMRINVSKESEVSLRDQIAVQVEFLIATRKLEAAESLPSVRALATRLKIHHNTVSQAYRDLVEKGLLVRRRGSRLAVRSPEEPLTPTPARDLDDLINGTVHIAQQHGFTMQQLRHRVRARLLAEPPDHILALSIDAGMRTLFRLELTESLHCPVETCPPEKLVENPGLAIGALVLSPPGLMPQVVSALPKDRPVVRITYSLADEHIALVQNLQQSSVIAVASISEYFLRTARGVLAPVVGRRHSMREYLLDGRIPRGLGAPDILFCDAMVYRLMRTRTRRINVVPYQLISADCLAQVSSAMSGPDMEDAPAHS